MPQPRKGRSTIVSDASTLMSRAKNWPVKLPAPFRGANRSIAFGATIVPRERGLEGDLARAEKADEELLILLPRLDVSLQEQAGRHVDEYGSSAHVQGRERLDVERIEEEGAGRERQHRPRLGRDGVVAARGQRRTGLIRLEADVAAGSGRHVHRPGQALQRRQRRVLA